MSGEEDELLDTLLRLTGQPVPERPKPEPLPNQRTPSGPAVEWGHEAERVVSTRPQSPRGGPVVATERQIAFLRKLIAERDGFDYVESGIASGMSKAEASKLIETVMAAPRRPRAPRANQARRELTKAVSRTGHKVRKITAIIDFTGSPPYLPTYEEAVQTLVENVANDGCEIRIEWAD